MVKEAVLDHHKILCRGHESDRWQPLVCIWEAEFQFVANVIELTEASVVWVVTNVLNAVRRGILLVSALIEFKKAVELVAVVELTRGN